MIFICYLIYYILDRNIAWLLYTVANYYCQPAVWAPMVRQEFKLNDAQINRIESDFEGSSERQYRVLLSWIKRLGLGKCVFSL